jgi:hypothetical protein
MIYRKPDEQSSCPCCGQPMPQIRCGVRLPPLKAAIFDRVESAGADGVAAESIWWSVYPDQRDRPGINTIKSHVGQINEAIADPAFHIRSRYGIYRLAKFITKRESTIKRLQHAV